MGKTANGAVWLDPKKTPPFEFYQYWRNIGDDDVMRCLRMLTFLPLSEIEEMEDWEDGRINEKKEILAYQLTSLVHGEAEAAKARQTARALFSGKGSDENMPATKLSEEILTEEGIRTADLLIACELVSSRSEARRLILQGGLSIDGKRIEDPDLYLTETELRRGVKIKKGKKVFHRAVL